MKKILCLVIGLSIYGCKSEERKKIEAHLDSLYKAQDEMAVLERRERAIQDSLNEIRRHDYKHADADYKALVRRVEKQFWKTTKSYDREMGTSYGTKLHRYFATHKTSPYELYIARTEVEKQSIEDSKEHATNVGLQEKKSYEFIDEHRQSNLNAMLKEFNMEKDQFAVFSGHYCMYYLDDGTSCIDNHCKLLNYEFWPRKQ